jgi:hypothetical protein
VKRLLAFLRRLLHRERWPVSGTNHLPTAPLDDDWLEEPPETRR